MFRLEAEHRDTPLLQAALAFFSVSESRNLIPVVYTSAAGADELAAFGAEVIRLAEGEDPDALAVLTRQMKQFASLAAGLLETAQEAKASVGLYGGVFQHSALARALFTEALSACCPGVRPHLPERSPALGAVILAMMRDGIPAGRLPVFEEENLV